VAGLPRLAVHLGGVGGRPQHLAPQLDVVRVGDAGQGDERADRQARVEHLEGRGAGMSDMPNGIPIQQHQRYLHSIADHNRNDISDIGKKRPICYHNSNDISAKMARKYDILTDTIFFFQI
jgi:hypothetical protein